MRSLITVFILMALTSIELPAQEATILENDQLNIVLSALQELDKELIIMSDGSEIGRALVKLEPLEILNFNIDVEGNSDYSLVLGEELLCYASKREDLTVDRTLFPNDDFNNQSSYGAGALLYLQIFTKEKINGLVSVEKKFESITSQYPIDKYVMWIKSLDEVNASRTTEELKLGEYQASGINNVFLMRNELLSIINQ
ncbi:MAG: hypothetical protein PVH48_11235 [Cyclobacteriaceae bacterium]